MVELQYLESEVDASELKSGQTPGEFRKRKQRMTLGLLLYYIDTGCKRGVSPAPPNVSLGRGPYMVCAHLLCGCDCHPRDRLLYRGGIS